MKMTQRNRIDKNLVRGGGGIMSHYKPLIATSLALALGVSVASATTAPCPSGSAICYSTDGGKNFEQTDAVAIQAGSTPTDFNQLFQKGGTALDSLTFQFEQSGSTTPTLTGSTLKLGGNNAEFKLTNVGKGLLLKDDGTGTLTIDFMQYEGNGFARKAILNFEGTTTAEGSTLGTALKGQIQIKAGSFPNDEVQATFNGDMRGNITITAQYHKPTDDLDVNVKTNFNFKNGSSLKGNLEAKYVEGGQNFTFEGNGGIEGKIETEGFYPRLVRSNIDTNTEVSITFKGENNFIKKGSGDGKIQAYAGQRFPDSNNNAYNRILFEGKGTIGENAADKRMNIIAHALSWKTGISEAQNLIQFKKQATLYLDKLQVSEYKPSDRRNMISLEGDTNTLDINTIEVRNSQGRNFIGKGFLTLRNGGTAKDLTISIDESKFADSEYAKAHIAKGTLTAGTIKTATDVGGTNGIFIENLEVTKGIYASAGGGNRIFIGGSGTIGQVGIKEKDDGSEFYSIVTTAKNTSGGNNFITLENDNTTLTLHKGVRHTWQGWQTEFNLNGNNNKIHITGNNTNGTDGTQIANVGVDIGGGDTNAIPGMTFNFNGNNGELDVKSGGDVSGMGNIIVGCNNGDQYAKLTFNVNGDNTTIKGNIFTQGGANIDNKNTTEFNIANGKSVEVQGSITNQKATAQGGNNSITQASDSAQTIFNFQSPTSGNGAITTLKLKNNIENTSGNVVFNFNAGDSRVNVASGSTESKIITNGANATTTFNLANGTNATIEQEIATSDSGVTNIAFNGNSTLTLQGKKNQITTISATGANSTLNLSSNAQATLGQAHNFNLLEIGKATSPAQQNTGLTADNLTFVVSVDTATTQTGSKIGGVNVGANDTYGHAYSDRIIVHNVGASASTDTKSANLAVAIDPSQTSSIKYSSGGTETEHNIAVATIKNRDNSDNVNDALATFTSVETINGGEKILIDFEKVATDENGKVNGANGKVDSTTSNNTYTTYFLGKAISLGVDNTTQQALASALSINYDLYIANLNSLNKRMGELRDNPYTQGVWARVFGGLQESNFGLGARTSYVTAQGGYDYALETEGAKNYIGLAFSYMHSKGESNKATQASNAINVSGINTIYLSNIQSSGYEIALYNSYVSNVGLYNDTIAKLSYITSDFSLSNSSDHNNTANNLGFTLSNEVGYRFILGEQQDYFIDPQLELSLGYLNQSDFTTKMKTRSGKGNQLKALQESVFLTRTRLGASFGKKIVEQDKNISLYVGTFYEYDLVTGGSNKLTTSTTKAYNPEFASNGRVVLNVGSNLELNQSTRVYVDVEKSFGDKLRTQLQFNLGARYSFGEKTSIENAKAQTTAPLRVGNTPTEETEKASIVPSGSQKVKDTGTKAANQ
ncbi:hypothetical protein BBW65_01440 [Helicobacter enhydrae]|uniref:Autotransporter domain-containing protein n=1 Tax=Helicobacter enhydrae TaxID=222136 RepID=A0A1B1U484_9HELI|nr:autotransporter outer membrane beta-barrel domain-containing protein [Helicobacter enhydrae]ANV97551.1 hypothetical protein BBW65_01440 [Helicobacter enhydrae]